MNHDANLIAHYMRGIQRAKDGRGRYANEFALFLKLRESGSDSISMMTAQAARRVAEAVAARAQG